MSAHHNSSATSIPVLGKFCREMAAGAALFKTITGGTTTGDTGTGGVTTVGVTTGGVTSVGVDVGASGTTITGVEVGVTGGVTSGGTTGGGTDGAAQVGLLMGLMSRVTAPLRANTLPSTEAPVFTVTEAEAKIVPAKLEFVPSVADEPTCQKILHT